MPTVQFTVPYFFDATYVPPGKRKPVGGMFYGTMQIEIENVTSLEAPVAVAVTRDDGIDSLSRDFHAYEGSFYCSQTGLHWHSNAPEVSIDQFGPEHLDHYPERRLASFNQGKLLEKPAGEFFSIFGRVNPEFWDELIEHEKEAIRTAAANLLFVDGRLLRKGALPTILTQIEYRMSSKDRITVDIGKATDTTGVHGMMFAIDELTSAVAWAEDRLSREHHGVVDNYLTVEVQQSHLLPREPILVNEVLRLGRFLFSRDINLKDASDAYLLDFIQARGSLNRAIEDPSDDNLTLMLEAWQALYQRHGAEEDQRRKKYGSSYNVDGDIDYMALMGTMAAWENRPIFAETSDFGLVSFKP